MSFSGVKTRAGLSGQTKKANSPTISSQLIFFIYLCIFLTGAAGLVYQVVWARRLALFLGITTYAHTAVLTAYMVGLAAGSLVIGRRADRQRAPLRTYGVLEIAVGVYALCTPWIFAVLQTLYARTSSFIGFSGPWNLTLGFTLALLVLLVPTFLMGGTLPLLVRGLTGSFQDLAESTGRLYGLNTLGAAVGAFAAGYLLLPALGVNATLWSAVVLSVGAGLAILALNRRFKSHSPQQERLRKRQVLAPHNILTPKRRRLLLAGFGISGFAALVYEILWIRALTLVIGSSVYAFSATLTTYLLGIALGSLLFGRFASPIAGQPAQQLRWAAALQGGISLTALVGLILIGQLPALFLRGYVAGLSENFALFQAFIFGLCFLIMFWPTLLLGALFPLITALWTEDADAVGRGVGTAYAVNATGNIAGALLGGLVLLPILGIQHSMFLAAGLSLLVAVLFRLIQPESQLGRNRLATVAFPALVFTALVLLLPDWDKNLMQSGVFFTPERWTGATVDEAIRNRLETRVLLYYAEGIDGVVSVVDSGQRLLVINGKTDASSRSDLPTQIMVGQLPLLLHPNPQKVLMIGLGSGITAGAAASHAAVAQLDVLEISPEVVAASDYFLPENDSVLTDPRTNLIIADARNYTLATNERYDVIVSEPSNPWISGISNLFTQEYFELARDRLAPGGIMSQWFHTYSMSTGDVKTVLHTFQSVFPYVSVWSPMSGDLVLIGSENPHPLDYARIQQLLEQPAIAANLAQVNYADYRRLLDMFLLDDSALAAFTAGSVLNTDNRPYVEFNAPRNLYAATLHENLATIVNFLEGGKVSPALTGEVMPTASGWVAPPVEIAYVDGNQPVESLTATWLVERTSAPIGADAETVTGHQLLIRSQAGAYEQHLLATFFPETPTAALQQAVLQAAMVGGLEAEGTVDAPNGEIAYWAIGPGAQAGEQAIGLTWVCRASTGSDIGYIALELGPVAGDQDRQAAAENLAQRYRCGPAG